MAQILIARTSYDQETSYSAAYCEPIIKAAATQGHRVIDVTGPKVVSQEVVPRLEKIGPKFFLFSGHGTKDSLLGHKDALLIDKNACRSLRGAIVFCRACDALVELGPAAVSNGCPAFIGYKKKFWGVITDGYLSRPLQDPYAAHTYENSNVVPLQLCKGTTIQEAVKEAHKDAARKMLRVLDLPDPWASATLLALSRNDRALAFVGDETASIK